MLAKQPATINFSQGVDTKTDPFQISAGKFLFLKDSVFTTGKRLTKRNGFGPLASLPYSSAFVTTFNDDLTAIGSNIQVYSSGAKVWTNKGSITPLSLSTMPLIRNNLNQSQADSTVASNGYICTVFTESNGTTNSYKYVIADSVTGQNIIAPTAIANADATLGTPKVFLLGSYFAIVYTTKVSANYHLSFIAVSTSNPTVVSAQADISTSYTPASSMAFGGVVFNNSLYLAWNGASASGIKMATVSATLIVSAAKTLDASHVATVMSVCSDQINSVIWVSYYNSGSSTGYAFSVDPNLTIQAGFPAQIISSGTILNLASAAVSGVVHIFYEISNTASGIQTNLISSVSVNQSTAVVSSVSVILRSAGLASKAFFMKGSIYFLAAYSSQFQPTYFLVNGSASTSASPRVVGKIAYENGGGYLSTGLPSVSVSGTTASVPYLFKDLIQPLADSTSSGTTVTGGVYSQTGINLVTFDFTDDGLNTAEIGSNLNITGGYLQAYDGYLPVEHNFHLYPDSVQTTATATTGGHLIAQIYYAIFTYEWTDNQGNAYRSAGSIPVKRDISGSGTSTNTITWVVPTLRITSKVSNPVKIVGYRWSTAQQTFYQFTSITAPTLNDTTADSVTIVDTLADTSIVGNNILYTTGGVIEDTGAPASSAVTLFDDRIFLIDAEDENLLWYSKEVIEATPVEMSDLLTLYVAPTIGATGPTGPMKSLSAMDDKLIIFKKNAINYINGRGPDNTGANNQYSQPTFVTSMVGCSNQKSIVFQPQGLMFEFSSEAGNQIWLLGRDLSTRYIGDAVEGYTSEATVLSAIAVPGTNQVRFNLSSGITLMFDYYYEQWGIFSTNGISSTLYQGLHTYINSFDQVFQETPDQYLDGTNPVLIGFITGWLGVSGIRGYERIYEYSFLGTYYSPHKLVVQTAFDYEGPSQQSVYSPPNFSPAYGNEQGLYGSGSPYGGASKIEQFRVFAKRQKCKAFQISVQEIYDPSFGVAAGKGVSLSGINLVLGVKKGWAPVPGKNSIG